MRIAKVLSVILLASMILVACAPKTSSPAASVGTPVATIPAASLAQANHLLICTDFPYPPRNPSMPTGIPRAWM